MMINLNSLKKIIFYSLSILLVGLYSVVIYNGFNAGKNVSLEYKMFYIDKKLDLWPGDGGLQYKLGDSLNFGTNKPVKDRVLRMGKGWMYGELGYWIVGEESKIYFTKIPQRDLKLSFKIVKVENKNIVNIAVNSVQIAEFVPSIENNDYSFNINKEMLREDGFLEISFSSEESNMVLFSEMLIKEK